MNQILHSLKIYLRIFLKGWFWSILMVGACIISITPHALAEPQSKNSSGAKPVCHVNDQFVVIINEQGDDIGSEITIRRKSESQANNQCNSNPNPTDLRVAKFGEAKYFIALRQNFLILDQGTSTDIRNIIIIDMSDGREIWKEEYYDEPKIMGMKVKIMKFVDHGTKKICPNYQKIIKQNWTPLYVIPLEYSLISLKAKSTGSGFCVEGQ